MMLIIDYNDVNYRFIGCVIPGAHYQLIRKRCVTAETMVAKDSVAIEVIFNSFPVPGLENITSLLCLLGFFNHVQIK